MRNKFKNRLSFASVYNVGNKVTNLHTESSSYDFKDFFHKNIYLGHYKRNRISILIVVLLFGGCSIKKNDLDLGRNFKIEKNKEQEKGQEKEQEKGKSTDAVTKLDSKKDPLLDRDGDGVIDSVEIERGSDPLIADVPIISSNFIQNFEVEVKYNKVNDKTPLSLLISTKVKDTDSSFRYNVGKLFGIDNSAYFAAKEGRFSGHSYGEIKNEDFTWVKYPTLDPLMLHSDIIKFRPIIDGEDSVSGSKFENHKIKITLDSTVKLTGVRFKEIKNLSINFYYHDFSSNSYELLKNVIINRTFQRNINESFTVEIENVPLNFLKDSYFKHGEFLVSEIDNYYIPELDKDYKSLMASVKVKTLPVLMTTPSGDSIYYVATTNTGISFLDILNMVFVKNFTVENNILKKIGQYENNIGEFEYLKDIREKDKLGKWFVLTNKFKEHFMDHFYISSDHVTLSYITGKNLATQAESVQVSYNSKKSTETYNETVISLGSISPNSKVEIQLKGINRFGHEPIITPFNGDYHYGGGNGGTLSYSCSWIGYKRSEFLRDLNLSINYNEEWEKIFLVINEERYKLSTLISEKKVTIRNIDLSFQVSIDDISKIKLIKQGDDNKLSLSMTPTVEVNHQGIVLVSQRGNQNSPWCDAGHPGALSTFNLAVDNYSNEISKSTLNAKSWAEDIEHYKKYPNDTGAAKVLSLKLMDDIDYEKNYSIAVSSKIINYFN